MGVEGAHASASNRGFAHVPVRGKAGPTHELAPHPRHCAEQVCCCTAATEVGYIDPSRAHQ